MADSLSDRQARLSVAQKAALDERIRQAAGSTAPPTRIPVRTDRDAAIPLSSTQQRLWFLDQLVPGNSAYNVTRTLRIEGTFAPEMLARAFDAVVARHESLRTRMEIREGVPNQVVAPPGPVEMPVVSLEEMPESERAAAAVELARSDGERPFDLRRGPLLRALLLRISPTHHVLHVTAHHIVTDGWSMELLFREVSALYDAGSTRDEAPPPLPALALQYPDFCLWQRKWLESDAARGQIAHWADKLRGAASLDLPADRPRPVLPSFRGVQRTVVLPAPVLIRLKALGREEGATLFMVLLAAFQVFLQRHSGQDDVSVATPIAGRSLPELEPLIGFFANTLVLRGDLSGDPRFREVLRRVRETSLDAFAQQEVPLEQLVHTLRPERHLSQNPLAQALLVLQNAPSGVLDFGPARVTPIELVTRTARFDLELHAREIGEGLSCMLIASADMFDEDTVDRFLKRFDVLLSSIVASPDLPISHLALLPAAERQRVLSEWNRTEWDIGASRCIQELFEEQVARTPDSVAVRAADGEMTYRELNSRADRVARRLRDAGVGPDVLVGVCLERTPDLVVALLGVWKARGAYVPLDPSYPAERLEYMLEDSGARVLIAQKEISANAGESCVRIPLTSMQTGPEVSEIEDAAGDPSSLAYVLYTSGSTGRPKGVAIEHGSVFAFIRWAQTVFGADELEAVLASTSICFDLSVFELFVPLCSGGSVVLAADALDLPALIGRGRVTLVNTVPSAIAELVRMNALPDSVKTLNLAGEPLSKELAARVYSSTRVEKIYNLYGPTESTTYSTFVLVPREGNAPITIGRPILNTRVYLVDSRLEPTPIGVAGELCIAGAGVARGYLRRPELTAEKFSTDPFRPGADRLYRTGDLARYRGDGEIEFLGRRDGQVKIRGFRIETGEIEAALRLHPEVREAAVVARRDQGSDLRLVAYVVGEASASELRRSLKRQLPNPMVPAAFVFLDALPMTLNGKLDRRALPAPGEVRPDLGEGYAAPRTIIEEKVVAIWSELLGLERLGIHDNFFELGGHSLLATRMISRLRDLFGVELPLRLLFQMPTVAEVAEAVSQAPPAEVETRIARLDRPNRPPAGRL